MSQQNKNVLLKFVKASDKACTPTKGSLFAAGHDLYSAVDEIIKPWGKAIISTDLIVALPMGTYGRIAPRSGLATYHSINVGAGVIDPDFRGIIKIILFNHSNVEFQVKRGDRVAQLICEKIVNPDLLEVSPLSLSKTVRGSSGFGSSGLE